jgi:hypothetical protein
MDAKVSLTGGSHSLAMPTNSCHGNEGASKSGLNVEGKAGAQVPLAKDIFSFVFN